ncbi:MAG: MCE family protein [Fischerella sp.]|uniref:MlaD family protein n=1 Tax=Fischerella sp. TaxID=1191 RepID=UPI0017982C3F|nr:MlaD family protein [Fischerella sp.]NWF62579.1 MCE family protein [Fischerella sp.]
MRSRTFREGSVGLLILLGAAVFGVIILWLNRFTAAQSSYKAVVEFANAGGMQKGSVVRYRGVKVGNISAIRPGPNNVEVEIEIANPNLVIPRDVRVEANQSGLISESIIDITPESTLPTGTAIAKPLDRDCDPSLIICDRSRLQGQIGISLDELIRSSTNLATLYTQPKVYENLNEALENASDAAAQVAVLSREITSLTRTTQRQLNNFSTAANSVADAADRVSTSTSQTVNQFSTTAKSISSTANQANQLLKNLDSLVTTNRSSLVSALNNITETSNQLRTTVAGLSPTLNRLTQGELVQNLETLSANAAQASANLRDASRALNDPNNLLVLQQTLDSARVTFENTQKITSDLDELTGDPSFRENLRQLVNGLSTLVSSTQQMQQQVEVANTLDAVKTAVRNPNAAKSKTGESQQQTTFYFPPTALKIANKQLQPAVTLETSTSSPQKQLENQQFQSTISQDTPTSSQEKLLQKLRDRNNQRQYLKNN